VLSPKSQNQNSILSDIYAFPSLTAQRSRSAAQKQHQGKPSLALKTQLNGSAATGLLGAKLGSITVCFFNTYKSAFNMFTKKSTAL
jgi:hypothetical protein